MASIPEQYLDLMQQKKAFANLATVMADGSPQVTPVWFDYTDGMIRVNTAKGRVKSRTLRPGAPVALAIMDPDNPYRYVQIRGRVAGPSSRAQTPTSTRWRRNISAKTPIRSASPARFGSCTRSSRSRYPEWAERIAGRRRAPHGLPFPADCGILCGRPLRGGEADRIIKQGEERDALDRSAAAFPGHPQRGSLLSSGLGVRPVIGADRPGSGVRGRHVRRARPPR